ncbi:hypothetical protein SADO_00700 [Salinisphaera dokdonensis CL-ES53]|uniref:Glycosyltransferase RgtA/B/C/D-like domain-containing protein n=2 Tax=Salinisphaera TaxID=180541 RepID=A0ABV2AVW8_9GAMM
MLYLVWSSIIFKVLIMFTHESINLFGRADISDYWDYFAGNPHWLSIFDDGSIKRLSDFYASLYGGPLYALFSASSYVAIRSINIILTTFGCIFTFKVFEIILRRPVSWGGAVLLLFWPDLIRFSMELGRMPVTVFLVAITVWLVLVIYTSGRVAPFKSLLLLVLAIALTLLRPPYGFIVFGLVTSLMLLAAWRIRATKRGAFALLVLIPVLGATFLGGAFAYNQVARKGQMIDVEVLQQRSERDLDAGSEYLKGLSIRNPADLVWYTPLFGFYFLYSPLPWSAPSFNPFYFGAMAESMLLLWLSWLAFKRRARRYARGLPHRTALLALVGTLVLSGMLFGSGVSVAGQAVRYRLPLVVLAIPFLVYFSNRKNVLSHPPPHA